MKRSGGRNKEPSSSPSTETVLNFGVLLTFLLILILVYSQTDPDNDVFELEKVYHLKLDHVFMRKSLETRVVEEYGTPLEGLTQREVQALLRDLFHKMVAIFNGSNVTWSLHAGMLLGLYRDGHMIPWDHDLDFSIFERDCEEFSNGLQTAFTKDEKYASLTGYVNCSSDSWGGQIVDTKTGLFGDIYLNRILPGYEDEHLADRDRIWWSKHKIFTSEKPGKWMFPYNKVMFDGIEVSIPNDPGTCLQTGYGRCLLYPPHYWSFRLYVVPSFIVFLCLLVKLMLLCLAFYKPQGVSYRQAVVLFGDVLFHIWSIFLFRNGFLAVSLLLNQFVLAFYLFFGRRNEDLGFIKHDAFKFTSLTNDTKWRTYVTLWLMVTCVELVSVLVCLRIVLLLPICKFLDRHFPHCGSLVPNAMYTFDWYSDCRKRGYPQFLLHL